jgi:cysteinyl-tRNA synthetase
VIIPPMQQAVPTSPPLVLRLGGRPVPVVGRARVYVCGITPYAVTHLGHAATYLWADVAVRLLRRLGAEVELVRNVTDVDDVLVDAARLAGEPYQQLAAVQQFYFDRDMAALGVQKPTHEPRAHSYVRHAVELAAVLLGSGQAYHRNGTVYYRGAPVAAAAGLDRAEALALAAEYGDRPDDPDKEDALDVVVWQASTSDEPAWPSPWGPGRPGWHAECAAMALSTLGSAVDLLAGGADLRYPHHAFQAALVEAVTGVRPFARGRLQAGTVMRDGRKMAKSAGNLVLVGDLLAGWPAPVVRMLLIDRRWQEPWDYREDLLEAAAGRLDELYAAAGRGAGDTAGPALLAVLCDDLDVPRAVDLAVAEGGPTARALLTVLGLQ